MENFKSFGRKISIPFLQGYTSITGPNGSGKSNIADAILFVLGPKSAKAIRAGKLTDLIWNGGKDKNGANECQVSLIFDNSDRQIPVEADEVKLTRYVGLSPSVDGGYNSYFYINDRKSSLSEFDSLLAHARISAEGYNLVQQGDIQRIVSMSSVGGRQGEVGSPEGGAPRPPRCGRRPTERTRAGDGGPRRGRGEAAQGKARWPADRAGPRHGRNRDVEGDAEADPDGRGGGHQGEGQGPEGNGRAGAGARERRQARRGTGRADQGGGQGSPRSRRGRGEERREGPQHPETDHRPEQRDRPGRGEAQGLGPRRRPHEGGDGACRVRDRAARGIPQAVRGRARRRRMAAQRTQLVHEGIGEEPPETPGGFPQPADGGGPAREGAGGPPDRAPQPDEAIC